MSQTSHGTRYIMWQLGLILLCASAHWQFVSSADSCSSRCNSGLDPSFDCQCNSACERYGDCCTDYFYNCLGADHSCQGRCWANYDNNDLCHCNDRCEEFQNCCGDFDALCLGGGGDPVGDISTLAQDLWDNDVNRLEGSDITVEIQTKLGDYSKRQDLSPNKLFGHVSEGALIGTWPSYMALLDNYNLLTGNAESSAGGEDTEIETFLDNIFATSVMSLTFTFLEQRGYFSSMAEFRAYVKNIWFTFYSRSGGVLDSSGFEHVFVGEVKNGAVSGYHNWLTFYFDEKFDFVNYYGYTSSNTPNQILMQFKLDNTYYKELASIIYGPSPEFELAMFTVCFLTNRNSVCDFTMEGTPQQIQTWDYTGGYIGSAYFKV